MVLCTRDVDFGFVFWKTNLCFERQICVLCNVWSSVLKNECGCCWWRWRSWWLSWCFVIAYDQFNCPTDMQEREMQVREMQEILVCNFRQTENRF